VIVTLKFNRVRVNAKYIYYPTLIDHAVKIAPGTLVKVINLPGAPKANTMGHCYVADADTGEFLAMVCTNSLVKPYTRKEIADIDGGKTALALCGYEPFGDVQSIRHRLDAARAQVNKLITNADELAKTLPGDEYVTLFRREARVWQYAIRQGEKLLASELAK
jgi:hypothetical protein